MSSQYTFCVEHEDEYILGICFDSACSKNPEYCYQCKTEGIHQNHQYECLSFSHLNNRLLEIINTLNEKRQSFLQLLNKVTQCLTDLLYEIFSKQLEDCEQLQNIIKNEDCDAAKKNIQKLNLYKSLEKISLLSRIQTIEEKCKSFLTNLNETQTDLPIYQQEIEAQQIENNPHDNIENKNEQESIPQEKGILPNFNEQCSQEEIFNSFENKQEYNDDAYLEFVIKELENETQIQNIQESEQLFIAAKNNQSNSQLALSYLDQAIQLFEYNEEAILLKGKILHDQEQYVKSIECLKRVLEYNPRSVEANYLYADSLHILNRLPEADQAFKLAIQYAPYQSSFYSNRACVLNKMGRYQEAMKLSDQAINLDKENASAYNNKAHSLLLLQRYAEALQSQDLAIQYQPNYVDYWTNKGVILLRMNKINDAIICKEKIEQLDSRTVNSFNFISLLLKRQGKMAEAIEILQQGLQFYPNDQQLQQELQSLIMKRY